jgi:acetoin utilization deacetylase AcuC-like enzyme
LDEAVLEADQLNLSPQAEDGQLLLVHTGEYLAKVKSGNLDRQEIRRLGFPWTPQLVERSRRSVGGTLAACRSALQDGLAVNLAGGTHHAFPDHGEGFCVFNDCAVAARAMQAEGRARQIAILDCDVHQGNGTAAIFASDPTVFTFSIHGARNFPFHKVPGDLDIALPDGTGDGPFLQSLRSGLQLALRLARPDLAIYLAGADPFAGDRLGRLSLSKAGLVERDRLVFESCHRAGTPVAVVLSGGYARDIEDTVDIHLHTVALAAACSAEFSRESLCHAGQACPSSCCW